MRQVVITAARRTPIGKFMGSFLDTPAPVLGSTAVRAALASAGVDAAQVDEVVFGQARLAGNGPNPARQVVRGAGLPDSVPAFTVNKACGSGLKAVVLASQAIRLGEARIVVAGGMENMSRVPYFLDRARTGYRLGNGVLLDAMVQDGFLDPLSGSLMGETAETLAVRDGISRREQDEYALASQERAVRAWEAGAFADEIVPVTVRDGEGRETTVERDEHPRAGTTLEKLGKLPPVFRPEGSVTAGNSSGITDGAAALVLMEEDYARAHGHPILARIGAHAQVGVDPAIMGIGPVPAFRRVFEATGLGPGDLDLIEINEAFAAQVLACLRQLPFDPERLNVHGGAIALGHPIGASGARILTTLVHAMRRRQVRRGAAALCISGGQGMALLVERVV